MFQSSVPNWQKKGFNCPPKTNEGTAQLGEGSRNPIYHTTENDFVRKKKKRAATQTHDVKAIRNNTSSKAAQSAAFVSAIGGVWPVASLAVFMFFGIIRPACLSCPCFLLNLCPSEAFSPQELIMPYDFLSSILSEQPDLKFQEHFREETRGGDTPR